MVTKVLIAHRADRDSVTFAASRSLFLLKVFRNGFRQSKCFVSIAHGPPPTADPGLDIDHPGAALGSAATAIARRLVGYRRRPRANQCPISSTRPSARGFEKFRQDH